MSSKSPAVAGSIKESICRLVDQIASQEDARTDQRDHKRHAFNVHVTVCNRSPMGVMKRLTSAYALDISYSGIGLLTAFALRETDDVYLNFEPAIGRNCFVPVRLVNPTKLVDGVYRTGAIFLFEED